MQAAGDRRDGAHSEVEPGDLILVQSRGVLLGLGRRVTGNDYDHVAVVGSDAQTINIDKPSARALPVERLLRPSLRPLVLRPRFANAGERARFVGDIEKLVGAPYDVGRTLALLGRLLMRRFFGVARPLRRAGWDRQQWICTDAVLLSLARNVTGFGDLDGLARDWAALACGTTNDLVEISRRRPDLLRAVSR